MNIFLKRKKTLENVANRWGTPLAVLKPWHQMAKQRQGDISARGDPFRAIIFEFLLLALAHRQR